MVDSQAEREEGKTEEGGGRTFPLRNFEGGKKEGSFGAKKKRGKKDTKLKDVAWHAVYFFLCNISVAAVAF